VSPGSVTKRLLCIPVQSTYRYKTRGEEQWHGPPRGETDAQTRKTCHAKMNSHAPSKPYLIATFLLRFHEGSRCLENFSRRGRRHRFEVYPIAEPLKPLGVVCQMC